jgi:hypothetical protein
MRLKSNIKLMIRIKAMNVYVHNWVEKFSEERSKVADDALPGAEVADQQSEDCSAAGFDALVKRWDKCINFGGAYVEK